MNAVTTACLISSLAFLTAEPVRAVTASGGTQTLALTTTLNNPTCTLSLAPTLGTGGNGSGTVAGSAVTYSAISPAGLLSALGTGGRVYGLPPLKLQLTCDAVSAGVSLGGKVTFTGTAGNCVSNVNGYLFCGAGTTSEGAGFVFKPGKTTVVWTGGASDEAVLTGNTIDVLAAGSAITSSGTVVKDIDVGVGISAARQAAATVVKAGHLATVVNFEFAWK